MRGTPILGSMFLIAGTALGAGMLALPITTGVVGFWPAVILFVLAASFMLYNLFLILEVSLWLPPGSDIITMVKTLLGSFAGVIAWISYLLLFYAVVAAYTAGGGPFVQDILEDWVEAPLPSWLGVVFFLGFLGAFLYLGIRAVGQLNKLLMFGLIITFGFLLFYAAPNLSTENLVSGETRYIWTTIPVIVFAFTSHLIVPSLRDYLHNDTKKLTTVLLVGSLIPLAFYIVWEFFILSIIPFEELKIIAVSDEPLVTLTNTLIHDLGLTAFGMATTFFFFFALVTSFLGVSIGLSHFLADGFRLKNRVIILLFTYFPPLFFVLFYPEGFIAALRFAGVCIIVLFGLLTSMMAWKGRYIDRRDSRFRVPGGKVALIIMMVLSVLVLGLEIANSFTDILPNLARDMA